MRKIKQLTFAISLIISPIALAEDFVPQEAAGLDAVNQLVEQPFVQQENVEEHYVSAEDQIYTEMMRKGWNEGWDDNKKRLFVVHSEMFDSEDPSYDDSFIVKRSQFAMLSTMSAKAKMVEFMRMQMSAVDQLTAPGTDVHAQLNAQYIKLERKIDAQQRVLEKMLREVNAAEADKLKGATWKDRSNSYIDALIKEIDASYDAANIEAKKADKFAKVQKRYQDAKVELGSIKEQAAAIKGSVTLESSSMVDTFAKAPILGATILLQSESWNADEEKYEVATLMVWSPKLERAATAIITGEQFTLKPKKAMTVQQWLRSQEAATLVGPRQYVDQNGSRWFIGAYAMPVEGSSSLIRKNKGIADVFAQKEAAMALYADLETHKQANIAMQTRSGDLKGKDHTAIATSFAETTRQSLEKRQVNGASKLLSKTIIHPISQQKVYVVAYGVSASSAADALRMEASSFQAASEATSANKANTAIKQALDKTLDAAKSAPAMTKPKNHNATDTAFNIDVKKSENASSTQSGSQSLLNSPSIDEDDF